MKRLLALALAVLFSVFILAPGSLSALAENDNASDGDGLYTKIPYVPEYKGNLSAQSRVMLVDLETGNAIIEQNGDVRAYPASTTKIMTAVLFIENTDDDEWDTPLPPLDVVNSEKSEAFGSQCGLMVGDCPTRRDLLYGLMLPSGCDCAYVISNLIAGSEEDFVYMMNIRASEIGMNNTAYENSYGVASNGHYTTAHDLAALVRHAMKNELFRKVVATESRTLKFYNSELGRERTIYTKNTNHLIRHDLSDYYPYAIGVKTGTTEMAAYCLTSAARKNGLELAAIIMNSEGNEARYGFSKELLEWGFKYYSSEGGMYSMNITNALFKAGSSGCSIYDVPESGSEGPSLAELKAGAGVRVGAYRYDKSQKLWYMVWHNGTFDWAKAEELEFVAYVNDISIEPGAALNGVTAKGTDPDIDGVIASRHLVKAVTVTVYDQSGSPVTGGSNYPAASCTHTLKGTTVDQDVDLSDLEPGAYTCVTKVEAEAFVPDAPDKEYIISEEKSVIYISDKSSNDHYTYSYNSNTGYGAPVGGTAEIGSAFTVSAEMPTKPGCRFAGWNTKADGSGTWYNAGEEIKPGSSITLYAMWEKGAEGWNSEIDPKFSDNRLIIDGGLFNEAGITAVKVMLDALGSTSSEPVFIDTEYCCTNDFSFESFNENLGTFDLGDGDYKLTISAAHALSDLEPVFEKTISNKSSSIVTVTFDPNGGRIIEGLPELKLTAGEAFGSLPSVEKAGAEFLGWYDSEGNRVDEAAAVPYSESGAVVIKAHWDDDQGNGSIVIHTDNGFGGLPVWVWLIGGALVFAALIALIVYLIKKPEKNSEKE